jgi:hypothetical protein
MFVGEVATQAAKAEPLERVLRGVVVVRGTDPLPVRDPVVLELPKDAITGSAGPADSGSEG